MVNISPSEHFAVVWQYKPAVCLSSDLTDASVNVSSVLSFALSSVILDGLSWQKRRKGKAAKQ